MIALTSGDITGVDELAFSDAAADPTADARFRRSGDELTWRTQDARTNTVTRNFALLSDTTGVPAASIGIGMLFQAESGDENPSDFGALDFAASDVGAGTEDTFLSLLLRIAGRALDEKYRFSSTAGDGFAALFTHAVTADRTYTLPDETGTVLTDTGHNVAANVHGLPASVNVLGNRSASGEFIQRGTFDPAAAGTTDNPVYISNTTVTFPVAFNSTPFVMSGGGTGDNDALGGTQVITTTTFRMIIYTLTSGSNPTDFRWVALGT